MGHLIFRCEEARRIIMTGVQMAPELFGNLRTKRAMRCGFCGHDHEWELVGMMPPSALLMSLRAENFLGRSLENEAFAAKATDPGIRDLYERMAGQWFRLAVENEAKAAALS